MFTAITARLWLGEKMGGLAWVGAAVALAGVPLITKPEFLFGEAGEEWTVQRVTGYSMTLVAAVGATGRLQRLVALLVNRSFLFLG